MAEAVAATPSFPPATFTAFGSFAQPRTCMSRPRSQSLGALQLAAGDVCARGIYLGAAGRPWVFTSGDECISRLSVSATALGVGEQAVASIPCGGAREEQAPGAPPKLLHTGSTCSC